MLSLRPRKIAVSGTACQGKTTLIADIRGEWPHMIQPAKTYRDLIKEKGLVINKVGNMASQRAILEFQVAQCKEMYGNNTVIFDRCPLDNLVYTLWLYDKGTSDITEEFVRYSIDQVKESVSYLDAIFFTPLTDQHKVPIVADTFREIDEKYIGEIDNIFKALYQDWKQRTGGFFKIDDAPALIEIFGPRDIRIQMMKMYIDKHGNFFGEKDSLLKA